MNYIDSLPKYLSFACNSEKKKNPQTDDAALSICRDSLTVQLASYFGEIRKNWNTMWNVFSVSLTCDITQKKKKKI